jgi:branched-chain amino acid transport system ATP-binding protein
MLEVDNISVSYGPIQILSGMSIDVADNEILAIVGPNGHGKTTLLKSIAGLNPPRSGEIRLNDERINGLPSHEIVRRGIVLLPEGAGYLSNFTVYENLKLGAYSNPKEFDESLRKVVALFPWLGERARQLTWTLSGGERRMLSIARCLMTDSSLLLLDELTWGVAPMIRSGFETIVSNIRKMGRSIIMAESDAQFVGQTADRVVLLKNNTLTPLEKSSLGEKKAERLL